MAKKINHREHREHRALLFSLCSLWLLIVPGNNKKFLNYTGIHPPLKRWSLHPNLWPIQDLIKQILKGYLPACSDGEFRLQYIQFLFGAVFYFYTYVHRHLRFKSRIFCYIVFRSLQYLAYLSVILECLACKALTANVVKCTKTLLSYLCVLFGGDFLLFTETIQKTAESSEARREK